jgi:magnesium chelatase family protein
MLARIHSAAVIGINAVHCEVEVDVGAGGFMSNTIVGLPDKAVKESDERVRSAIINSNYQYPKTASTIALGPADIKKEGPCFDLPMALGMLAGQKILQTDYLAESVITGELALDGRIRPIRGALSMALMARNNRYKRFICPVGNAVEAAVVNDIDVIPVANLSEAVGFLNGQLHLEPTVIDVDLIFAQATRSTLDYAQVKGQEGAKRALAIAAAGAHNLLMTGPPGSGKTMLTNRLPTILPPLTINESLETTQIHSSVGLLDKSQALMTVRPVRQPHHSSTGPSLVGGGLKLRPGEISLAHNGLLFLDEFPEFARSVLEMIRQPLEDRKVTVARAAGAMTFPANIMLVAAMNPCPCGYRADPKRACKCTPNQVDRYMSKISGPLLDRIDIHMDVPAVSHDDLLGKAVGTSSKTLRDLVQQARSTQTKRFADSETRANADMGHDEVCKFCKLDKVGQALLKHAIYELGLSARAHDKVLKVARTIADMEQIKDITSEHVAEAITYRKLDRA